MNRIQSNREKRFRSPAAMKRLKDAVEQFKIYNNGVVTGRQTESLNYFLDALTIEDTRNREIAASKEEVAQYMRSQRNAG
jgi:phosphoglycolate phosphatase-like HAD superfamily hydrolase